MQQTPTTLYVAQKPRSGLDFLRQRSRLALRLKDAPPISNVLIIDDNQAEADRVSVMVRLVLGDAVRVRIAKRIGDAKMLMKERVPDIVFLDDRLGHAVTAEMSLAQLNALGLKRPAIVMSGMLTRIRLVELRKLGFADVIHKDDLDASRIMEAILRAVDAGENGTPTDL